MTVEIRTEPLAEPKIKTVADVLRHAARIIEERGWTTGAVATPEGAVCTWGGIRTAVFGEPYPHDETERLEALTDSATAFLARCIADDDENSVGVIAMWNDESGRTAEEVTAALRAAADASEVDR